MNFTGINESFVKLTVPLIVHIIPGNSRFYNCKKVFHVQLGRQTLILGPWRIYLGGDSLSRRTVDPNISHPETSITMTVLQSTIVQVYFNHSNL